MCVLVCLSNWVRDGDDDDETCTHAFSEHKTSLTDPFAIQLTANTLVYPKRPPSASSRRCAFVHPQPNTNAKNHAKTK